MTAGDRRRHDLSSAIPFRGDGRRRNLCMDAIEHRSVVLPPVVVTELLSDRSSEETAPLFTGLPLLEITEGYLTRAEDRRCAHRANLSRSRRTTHHARSRLPALRAAQIDPAVVHRLGARRSTSSGMFALSPIPRDPRGRGEHEEKATNRRARSGTAFAWRGIHGR